MMEFIVVHAILAQLMQMTTQKVLAMTIIKNMTYLFYITQSLLILCSEG